MLDIKSKKSKPVRIWMCFFIGINVIILFIIFGIFIANDSGISVNELRNIFIEDIKNTGEFKHEISLNFDRLAQCVGSDLDEDHKRTYIKRLDDEGENLIFYAYNPKTKEVLSNYSPKNKEELSNTDTDLGISVNGSVSLPEGYDYYLYYDGEKLIGENDGQTFDVVDAYKNTRNLIMYSDNTSYNNPVVEGLHIFLVVKEDIVKNPNGDSSFYRIERNILIARWIIYGAALGFLLGIALLVLAIVKRKTKSIIDQKLAKFFRRFWIELKLTMTFILFVLSIMLTDSWYYRSVFSGFFIAALLMVWFWWFYFLIIDLRYNRSGFFSKNAICFLIRKLRSFEKKMPFQKAIILRSYLFIALESVIIISVVVLYIALSSNVYYRRGEVILILLLFIIAFGIYIAYWYLKRHGCMLSDIGKVMDHMEVIKNGDMAAKLTLDPDSDVYLLAEYLNGIQMGMNKAVNEMIKSERMKVELITNVSHDLKTPLTSIISYVDLLMNEKGLPEHVDEYIKILEQKSDRLKRLIQDLFDLSKATTGEMVFEKENLDLSKLIQQTLGDMDGEISQSGLVFRVNVPDEPVNILGDGKKLYRVFMNLFQNVLHYSLLGTRVYVDLAVVDNKAIATIKNTSNYEMNFGEVEILERFIRGDKARSTEGTGLGLSIAKSFTQACGGSLNIKVDGDLFKVIMAFNTTID